MSSASISSAPDFDLEDLVHLEQTFFDAGYTDGHAHGRTHGLIEGRTLGREKGYELWEEIGFYEGFAKVWEAAYHKNEGKENSTESRAESHIRHLLDLISQFPQVNPSAHSQAVGSPEDDQLDVTALLSKIRARYKALCATLGVKPRLRAAGSSVAIAEDAREVPEDQTGKKVWKLDSKRPQANPNEMSF